MRFHSMLLTGAAFATFAIGCGTLAPAPGDPASSVLRGRVEASAAGEEPVLLYLEPVGAHHGRGPVEAPPRTISLRRREGALEPRFVLASVGQALVFRNADDLHHALFSSSEPNGFELGTLAGGETKRIRFPSAGTVSFYCSLHESEHGIIFVAPSRYAALADSRGQYSFAEVPPGRYQLRAWAAGRIRFDREITLRPGESAWRSIQLGRGPQPG